MKAMTLQGTATRFKGNGRRLGYPTANFTASTGAKDGVYFGYSDMAGFKRHPSLIFIGIPTTMGDTERRVEVHLFDIPDKDYYDRPVTAIIEHYHRSNRTFENIEALQAAMKADETAARQWFADREQA